MMILFAALVGLCSLWVVSGTLAVLAARRGRASSAHASPALTVLKPLCGADPDLAANLESFFRQDYPGRVQILFGVEDGRDPAIAIARAVARRHPEVECTLVIHGGGRALNPKIANLRGMVEHAAHDLLLVSDSNVRVPPCYLSEAIAVFGADPRVGLVTHLFSGAGERSLGAALENVQLNGFVAAGAALPTIFGDAAVVGKSMLFSRRVFESLGGFESVRDLLAEDFIIGKKFQHAGFEVCIAPTVVQATNGRLSLARCLERQLRWSILRVRLRGIAFLLEPLASPLLLAPCAIALLGLPAGLAWAAALMLLRDAGQWWLLRGPRRIWIPLLLAPLRELAMLGVWLVTPFVKHVRWRGHRVRVGAGTHAFATRQAV